MTLTVPRSNRDPGRAPDVRVPTPETGDILAGLGDVMMQVGGAMEREQNGRALGRAKLDFQRGLNELDLELRQTNDPDVIDRDFPARVTALREQIAASLPDKIRATGGMELEAIAQPRTFAMGRHALDLRQSFSRTMLTEYQAETVRAATTLDAAGRTEQLEAFSASVAERLEAGILTPQQAQDMVLDARGSMDTATARKMLRENPEGLLSELEGGTLFGFDEDDRQSWLTRTTSAIESARATETLAAERAAKERQTLIGSELADAAKILKAGQVPDRLDEFASSEEYLSHPAAEDFGRALMLYENRPDFLKAPPAVMRRMLAEEEARPKGSSGELDITSAMRDALREAEQAWEEDPITASQTLGLGTPPDLPEDPSSLSSNELATALQRRAVYAESLTGTDEKPGWVDEPRLFTVEERERYSELAEPSAPPPQRAALAASFAKAFGDDTIRRITEIDADPLFAYVGGMVANGGSERLARDIFEGVRAIDSKDVPLPSETARRQTWFTQFDSLFDNEMEAGMRDQVIGAADALYAYRARGKAADASTTIAATDYMQAVHEVLGGTGVYDARTARGGVQMINNQATLLPPGVAGRDVNAAWQNVGRELSFETMQPDGVSLPAQADPALRELSVNGTAPTFGGQAMTSNTWANTGLRAVAQGVYVLVYDHPELGQTIAYDDAGDPWMMDLSKLLERGRR